jgi:hypothetical protein
MLLVLSANLTGSRPALAALQSGSGLSQLLNQVPDNADSRTVIWYGSRGALEQALGFQVDSQDQYNKLSQQQKIAYALDLGSKQIYYSAFSGLDNPTNWRRVFNIDPYAIDEELTVGATPKWYSVLNGQFSSGAVAQALQNIGYKTGQVGSVTVFSLGADNDATPSDQTQKLVGANYNRLIVSDQRIVAAPSTAMIQAATGGGDKIGSDPAYRALATVLENPSVTPGTLISAVLYDGNYLLQRVIGNAPGGVGLPRYQAAGIGYRRDKNSRFWVIALVYPDAATAQQASAALANGLPGYQSTQKDGRKLFDGWQINGGATAAGNVQVAVVTLQLPAQTDVGWIDLVQTKDIGFLSAR